jgi:IS30 family transposase
MDTGVVFFHASDERAFFEWLERIPCVATVANEGSEGLVVRLKHRPGQDDLRQLLALCHRWGLDMTQLAKFATDQNRSWFCDPNMYWHRGVFGG